MCAVKRLHARNKKTACEYTHLQVWVWDACNLHKSFNYNSLNVCTETIGFRIMGFFMNKKCECRDFEDNLHLFRFP